MSYNKRNYYKRVLEIQEITLEYSKKGWSYKQIYWQKISNRYHISYSTYSNYLGINAKQALKKFRT